MSFFGIMFLIFVFSRLGRGFRMRRWHRGHMYGWNPYRHLYQLKYAGQMPTQPSAERPSVQQPRTSAFEALKRKYVKGEISDQQYESALDALLKTPEGRREVDS